MTPITDLGNSGCQTKRRHGLGGGVMESSAEFEVQGQYPHGGGQWDTEALSAEERTGVATGSWESSAQRCELRLWEQEDLPPPPPKEGKDTEGEIRQRTEP